MESSLVKYPINILPSGRDIIIDLAENRKYSISAVWQQLLDKKDIVMMNSFEIGFLMSLIADEKQKVPGVWKQLVDLTNKFREDAGVKITELGNGLVQLKDDFGISIVREKYEWEEYKNE